MKILFLGNCQIEPLIYYVKKYLDNDKNYNFENRNVVTHLKDQNEEIDELIRNSDIVIQQNFYKERWYYDNEKIKEISNNKTKIFYIHCLYFEGYFPDTSDIFKFDILFLKTKVSRYETPYLDYLKYQGYDYSKIFEELSLFFNEDLCKNNLENTLNNLYERENGINSFNKVDVPIYDFIKNNYKKISLFHTCNHPTNYLLNIYALEIVKIIFKKDIGFINYKSDYEFLGGYTCPIYPSLQTNLNLEFDTSYSSLTFRTKVSLKEYIDLL